VGRRLIFFVLLASSLVAQEPARKPLNPEPLVNEWIKRLNALPDDPGKSVDRMAELFDPAAMLFTGPNENQIGPVMYSGLEGIRKWADNFAKAYSKSEYRIQVHTGKVKTAGLLHTVEVPWGGLSVAVELTAYYTMRDNHKKFMAPGAVFLEFSETGKIRRARVFLEKDETVEITQ